jgi:16S rRNA (uracil1498-N3)-methyltransferase
MKQFLLPVLPDAGGFVQLKGKDYHYLVRVRRLGPGDTFKALLPVLPAGREACGTFGSATPAVLVQVCSVDGEVLTGRCLPLDAPESAVPEETGAAENLPQILLFQALPKGTKMDLIVRQAAEMGVAGIVPFAAERSIPKLRDGDGGKSGRWERIVREARQQSGSGVPTLVHPSLDTDGLLAYWEALRGRHPRSLGLLLHQDTVSSPLEQGGFHDYLDRELEIIALAIGPEGGFSPAELTRFLEAGFKPLKVGDTILRTETAALCGLAAVRIILLENASWIHKPR